MLDQFMRKMMQGIAHVIEHVAFLGSNKGKAFGQDLMQTSIILFFHQRLPSYYVSHPS